MNLKKDFVVIKHDLSIPKATPKKTFSTMPEAKSWIRKIKH